MPLIPAWVARVPVLSGLPIESQKRAVEVSRFAAVGAMNWVVDLGVFNLFRWWFPPHYVIAAKTIAVVIAASFSWGMNRTWTFQERATDQRGREFVSFLVINAVGLIPPLACLWVSHYLLGLTSALADNVSANVIGLILGTMLRYFGYRHLVFTRKP